MFTDSGAKKCRKRRVDLVEAEEFGLNDGRTQPPESRLKMEHERLMDFFGQQWPNPDNLVKKELENQKNMMFLPK
jgi:hypothetical protein